VATDNGNGAPPRGRMTIVFLIHDAFRRDFARLSNAVAQPKVDAARAKALNDHWAFIADQLHHHHTVEDASLWPILRPKLAGDPDSIAVLDAMEAQHHELDPLTAQVTAGFGAFALDPGADQAAALGGHLEGATAVLASHLSDEEVRAFPVISSTMSEEEFAAFGKATSKAVGMRGSAKFFPWIFDGADPVERTAVLSMPPPPVRFACSTFWEPSYRKRSAALWGA